MLDPERVKLTAANIGFLKQKGIAVDFETIRKALQTDDGGCVNVRREAETPVNELHVMGGQRLGLEGNMNVLEYARQARQMNAYPLRSFSASAPAVILPPKYGGFPQYINNESERENYVSRFTEPMSAPLQQNTMLLGPQGFSVSSHSASDPFKPLGFELNLHKSRAAINYNEMAMRQRKFLQQASGQARANKDNNRGPPMLTQNDGIFVGPNGNVMSQVESVANGAFAQNTMFDRQQERVRRYQQFETPASDNGYMTDISSYSRNMEDRLDDNILSDNSSTLIRLPASVQNSEIAQSDLFTPSMTPSQNNGLQSGNIIENMLDEMGAQIMYTPDFGFARRNARRDSLSGGPRMARMNTPNFGFAERNARRESLSGEPSRLKRMTSSEKKRYKQQIKDIALLNISPARKQFESRGSYWSSARNSARKQRQKEVSHKKSKSTSKKIAQKVLNPARKLNFEYEYEGNDTLDEAIRAIGR